MIEVTKLSVIYPDQTKALDTINFTIKEEESVALIGANGAGKTSLLLAMVGVIPSEGIITVDKLVLNKKTIHQFRKKVGVVFQQPDDQLFMPTVYEDIAFGLRNYGVSEDLVRIKVEACLKELGILHLKDKSALKLSGGEKRVVALATVLIMEPNILLLDEPTAFLDPRARRNLMQLLNKLPHTKLIATHDLTFAKEVCKRTLLIKDGTVFAEGASEDLLYDEVLMETCGVESIPIFTKEENKR